MSKKKEIEEILNQSIDINKQLNILKNKYKNEIEGFIYLDNITDIINKKKIFIRYISISEKLEWGGFLYKIEKINNIYYLFLINKNKKIWKIDFNKNYIFYKEIMHANDNIRNIFMKFLENN